MLDAVIAYNHSDGNESGLEKGLTNLRGLCKDKRFCSEVEQAVYMLPSVVSPTKVDRETDRQTKIQCRCRERGKERERERKRGRWFVIV